MKTCPQIGPKEKMTANGTFLLMALQVSSTLPTPSEIGNFYSSNYIKVISNKTTVLLLNDLVIDIYSM